MATLESFLHRFARLVRAPGATFPTTTRNRAPHKPLLLLAVMEMVARGAIRTPVVSVTGELVELASIFSALWRRVMAAEQVSSLAFPFSRLANERPPFWSLELLPGQSQRNVTTVAQLRKIASGAKIDPNLFSLMKDTKARLQLSEALLTSHFSPEAQEALREELKIQGNAHQYSKLIEQAALGVKEAVQADLYTAVVRNQGFRYSIVSCYDHRCATCGTRIVTAEGYTAVDAAHIKPWSQFKNDEIRNGMALCKLCHWAFDTGLLAIADSYHIVVSREVATAPNAPSCLLTLADREILGPRRRELWPDLENLRWHRQNVAELQR